MYMGLHVKYPLLSSDFNENLPSGAKLFHAVIQKDRNMRKLIFRFSILQMHLKSVLFIGIYTVKVLHTGN
jgi:hypothetical protein